MEWECGDETVAEFFTRLEEGMFSLPLLMGDGPPDWFEAFRLHVEQREIGGRKTFGQSFVERDNPREAQEEAADIALYMLLSLLVSRRNGDREEWELALTAAKYAAEAHRYAALLRAHRHEAYSDYIS